MQCAMLIKSLKDEVLRAEGKELFAAGPLVILCLRVWKTFDTARDTMNPE